MSGGDSASYGQNAFFYDAAEGLLTSAILLVAEFCEPAERHIVSIFKIIQELLAPSGVKGKTLFHLLMDSLPSDHKARWFAGAALSSSEQAMASVMSTALARLHIRHIREKIEDTPSAPKQLITIKGLGYKLKKRTD